MNIIYCYIATEFGHYTKNSIHCMGNEMIKEFTKEFESLEEMLTWCYEFSNLNSIPIQFYI